MFKVVLPKCKDKKFPKSCAGFGFVQYKTEEDADKALVSQTFYFFFR